MASVEGLDPRSNLKIRLIILAYFSNFGPSVTIVTIGAQGVSILSTYLNGEYAIDSGTNMASPSVAGAAALIKADSPHFSANDVGIIFENSFLHSLNTLPRRGQYCSYDYLRFYK